MPLKQKVFDIVQKAKEIGFDNHEALNIRKRYLLEKIQKFSAYVNEPHVEVWEMDYFIGISLIINQEIDAIDYALGGTDKIRVLNKYIQKNEVFKQKLENDLEQEDVQFWIRWHKRDLEKVTKKLNALKKQKDFTEKELKLKEQIKTYSTSVDPTSYFFKRHCNIMNIEPKPEEAEKLRQQIKSEKEKELEALQRENLDVKLDKAKRADIHQVLSMFGLKTDQGKKIKSIYKTDHTPSMHIYSNCEFHNFFDYSTGQSGDVVKLYQDLAGVDFITAVNTLSNM